VKTQQLTLLRKISFVVLFLFLSNSSAAEKIGGVFEQTGNPGSIERTSGEKLSAVLDSTIVSMDNVETTAGRLKIEFVDKTQVSLTENTLIVINEYVYDPDPSKSKMAMNFVSGTARFATGGLGLVPKENIAIQTPTATIGVRGTDFTTTVDELGRSLVILLPDANCTDKVKLEEGCRPSGAITVTNDGGQVLLTEAYQAVMVSTFETPPTQPVVIQDLNLNMIDNMFIISEPAEITEAEEQQIEARKGIDYLAFNDLDIDFLEENLLDDQNEDSIDLEFSELDVDILGVDFLQDLLEILDEADKLAVLTEKTDGQQGVDIITGTLASGFDPKTQFNTIIDRSGFIWFYREVNGTISVKVPIGSNARLETDIENKTNVICVNDCSGINIYIRQTQG
jgi:hypothetical protein